MVLRSALLSFCLTEWLLRTAGLSLCVTDRDFVLTLQQYLISKSHWSESVCNHDRQLVDPLWALKIPFFKPQSSSEAHLINEDKYVLFLCKICDIYLHSPLSGRTPSWQCVCITIIIFLFQDGVDIPRAIGGNILSLHLVLWWCRQWRPSLVRDVLRMSYS